MISPIICSQEHDPIVAKKHGGQDGAQASESSREHLEGREIIESGARVVPCANAQTLWMPA